MRSSLAKVAHRVNGVPIVARLVRALLPLTGGKIRVIVGAGADDVREALEPCAERIRWIYQKEQLGTGHAVKQAESELASESLPVLIMPGDLPLMRTATLERIVEEHYEHGAVATVVTCEVEDPTGYGRILRSTGGAFLGIVEERDAREHEKRIREINTGVYMIRPAVLFREIARLSNENEQGEYYLTDVFSLLLEAGEEVRTVRFEESEDFMGVNDRVQLAEAEAILRRRKNEQVMRAGVTLVDPAGTYIEEDVEIGEDCFVEPGVRLGGRTRIGRGCRIGSCSWLEDAVLEDGVKVLPFSHVEGCILREGCSVGPFARLRGGAEIGESARIGNFVELKKTVVGRGSKASHLAYLGDAMIGEGVNVGAGTITCNYDGVSKHPTVVEDEVFIGSNSTLVAPIRLGRRSYVAAGSTCNRDVPPEALAIGRARQINKEGYRARLDEMARRKAEEGKEAGR